MNIQAFGGHAASRLAIFMKLHSRAGYDGVQIRARHDRHVHKDEARRALVWEFAEAGA